MYVYLSALFASVRVMRDKRVSSAKGREGAKISDIYCIMVHQKHLSLRKRAADIVIDSLLLFLGDALYIRNEK